MLRNALSRLQQLYPGLSQDSDEHTYDTSRVPIREEIDYTRRQELYLESIQSTREELHTSARNDRQWLTEALTLWGQIKELREDQGYVVTPVTMAIHRMEEVRGFLLYFEQL